MNTENEKIIAQFCNALSNPIRIAIIRKLASLSCCYHGDLTDELPIAKSTLSQHLNVLKEASLIQGEIKQPKVKYCINREKWKEIQGVMKELFEEIEK